ncbi:hypothetical protein ACQ4M3_10720 [Leptolyngbya sp. AN03gr2]|uniref:hypothetical protein n=1 Tax=unclassified Leptolyngbya TaxID=2650499 RepID=UPI003D31A902
MQSDAPHSDDSTSDAQQWEEVRQMFRAAGVPLSSDQESQWQQANQCLKTSLEQEFQDNFLCLFLRLFVMTLLPSAVLNIVGAALLGDAIVDYFRTMQEILTPEQWQVWEQTFHRNQ